jgi:hypothetical protein
MKNNKLAIFVEGLTEQIFVESLIRDMAQKKSPNIESISLIGGSKKSKPRIFLIKGDPNILIVNCGQDERVKSDIKDRYEDLKKAGYQKILGIRDARPEATNPLEIAKLRTGLVVGFSSELPVQFILSIMEFEAWIMGEYTHFCRMHPNITIERVKQEVNIDLINDDLSLLSNPAKNLKEIYWMATIEYEKSKKTIENIVSKLDQDFLRNTVAAKFNDLRVLYQELDSFFIQ